MTQTLLALLAPGSVEAEIGRVQQSIFKDHGLVSSVALPPLVPVAFLAGSQAAGEVWRALLTRLNAAVEAPYCITLAELSWHGGWLYLSVDSGGMWGTLRAAAALTAAAPDGTREVPCLFPAHEGFFLGCAEADDRQRALVQPRLPVGRFTSAVLSVVRMDVAEGRAWWKEVSMETLHEIPLRGRRP